MKWIPGVPQTARRIAVIAAVLLPVVVVAGEDKAPIPDKTAIAEAEKSIRAIFKDDYAKPKPEDRSALADKLLSQGADEQKDMAAKYVLLRDARDIFASIGDATRAIKAVTEMAKVFALDLFAEKTAALAKAEVSVRTPGAAQPLARHYAEFADEAIAADKYDIALTALNKASAAAQLAKNIPLLTQLKEKGQKAQTMQREYAAALGALKTVNEKPDDPAANLAVGKYICFCKEAWDFGLLCLAKGSDTALKTVAEKELAKPASAEEQMALADAWQATGEKQQGTARLGCLARACYWCEKAGPKLTGLARTKAISQVDAYDKAIGRVRYNPILMPDEQIKLLVERLKAVNPGYDGTIYHKAESNQIVELAFWGGASMTDPLVKVSDISPLRGLTLKRLSLAKTTVRDLSPLRGMGITSLDLTYMGTFPDVSPLQGTKLDKVSLSCGPVQDIRSMAGLLIKELDIGWCPSLSDLSPLQDVPLEKITLNTRHIKKGLDILRNKSSLKEIMMDWHVYAAADFWKKYDAGELPGVLKKSQPDQPDKKGK